MGRLTMKAGWPIIAATALACVVPGCSLITDSFVTNEFSGDPFPIEVELDSGAIVVAVRQTGAADRIALIDLLSPFTLVDPGLDVTPSVATSDLLLLGQVGATGPLEQPRARLTNAQVVALHPCGNAVPTCMIGPGATPRPYEAIIGADALAGDAVRLRIGDQQVFVLPDVGGSEVDRTFACDGVFPGPYRGGGTLLIGGTELSFGGRRIALQTCLGANPDPLLPQSARGADALLVMSTSIGITILGEAAYARYRTAQPTAPALDLLPVDRVHLPSGPIEGHRGVIDTFALVASSSSSPRGACRQVYASHFMTQRDCVVGDDCPCDKSTGFCGTPAVLDLKPPTGLDVLIVADANATLQALRTELRPDQAEVDGILGTAALATSEVDVDYPHNRLLVRCTADGCVTRPSVPSRSDRTHVQGCLRDAPPGPIF